MRKTFYKVLNFPSNNVLAIKKQPFIQLEQDLKLDEIIKNIKNQQLNVEKSDSQREFLCFRFVEVHLCFLSLTKCSLKT